MSWGDPKHPLIGKFALMGRKKKPVEIIGVHKAWRKGPVGGQQVERVWYRVKYLDSGTIKVYREDEAKVEVITSPLMILGLVAGR